MHASEEVLNRVLFLGIRAKSAYETNITISLNISSDSFYGNPKRRSKTISLTHCVGKYNIKYCSFSKTPIIIYFL